MVSPYPSCTAPSTALATTPSTRPTRTPASTASNSSTPTDTPDSSPVTAATTATLKATRAVASLNIPSPSRIVTNRWGSRSLRATAVAATGSGGHTIAPRTRATTHGRP